MLEVLAVHSMRLASEDDVLSVRRRVRELAEMRKFDTFAIAAITTAASELGRNVLVHGHGGSATIEEVSDGLRTGIRIAFVDSGPGIPDIQRVLSGGYSTARSMGLGLSGSTRLVDVVVIGSVGGAGPRGAGAKWKRF